MKLNKKLIIMLASAIGVVIVLIIVIMLFVGGGSKVIGYDKIEEKVLLAGQSYYEDNNDKLPKDGSTSVDVDTLVNEGYLNELSNYTEDNVVCDGKVNVTKNPAGYSYRVSLDCGKSYATSTLSSIILKKVVNSGSGLYETEQVSLNDTSTLETVYVFKGDNVDNYIKVGDYNWEIVKIYENGEVVVLADSSFLRNIWDDRYNVMTSKYNGINDYSVSRIKDAIDSNVVNVNDDYLSIKALITPHTACIGKRSLDDKSRDGSTECSEVLEKQYFSLLPVYDYMNASLDSNCNIALDNSCYNYNHLANDDTAWWTITGVADNSQDVYYVDSTLETDYASRIRSVRLYAHLDANLTYISGSGTEQDPYIVK